MSSTASRRDESTGSYRVEQVQWKVTPCIDGSASRVGARTAISVKRSMTYVQLRLPASSHTIALQGSRTAAHIGIKP